MALDASFLKYVSLFALLVQNCLVIILTRVIKHRHADVPFISSVAVLCAEVAKFVLCTGIVSSGLQEALRDSGSPAALARNLVADYGPSTLKCMVPALCYTVQNNLIYYALAHLEIVVFQLLYQTKLLLTAALSVCILRKSLKLQQWGALIVLFGGVVIVQLSGSKPGSSGGGAGADPIAHANGVMAAVLGSALSAFAGVYFELILKGDMQVSLWARNVQLCVWTVPISIATVYSNDGGTVAQQGLLGGFTPLVWSVVALQAFGGLIVAACMKYADNIMKNFASSGAIILGAAVSVLLFKFEMTPEFVLGAVMVLISMSCYDPAFCDCGAMPDLSQLQPAAASELTSAEEQRRLAAGDDEDEDGGP